MNSNRQRLIKERLKVTITGEQRIAYALKEIPQFIGIPAERLIELDRQYVLPPTIFLWGHKYYTGRQLSLIRDMMHGSITHETLKEQWNDPDREEDLW